MSLATITPTWPNKLSCRAEDPASAPVWVRAASPPVLVRPAFSTTNLLPASAAALNASRSSRPSAKPSI